MQDQSRKERFLAAKAAREKALKDKGGYSNPVDIPDFEYLLLQPDKCQVVRLVGESLEMRSKKSDPILVERSMIKADDGSYFNMIWHPDKDWPFRQLIRKLAKYKYEDKTKVYENDGCPYLNRYLTNDKEDPSVYETGMAPGKFVLMNVIDRLDSWCKDNKHTKVIAWNMNEKDGKQYYTPGMTYGLYKEIFDKKCTTIGAHFEEVDLVLRRFTQKTRPADDMYYAVLYDEEKRAIQTWSDKDKIDYYSFINKEEYLSDEEQSWERYDLEGIPFVSQPTPIGIIMSKLDKFIKGADKKYGWGLYEKFVEWKEQEIAEFKSKEKDKESSAPKTIVSVSKSEEDDDLPTDIEEKTAHEEKPTKITKVVKKAFEITDEMVDTFEGLGKLNPEQKKHITAVDTNEMTITFDITADAECGACSQLIPDEFTVCPYCGQEY